MFRDVLRIKVVLVDLLVMTGSCCGCHGDIDRCSSDVGGRTSCERGDRDG